MGRHLHETKERSPIMGAKGGSMGKEKTELPESAKKILEQVTKGPKTTTELHASTGFSKNTLRQGLTRLVEEGKIEQASEPRQTGERGRPAFVFQVPTKRAA